MAHELRQIRLSARVLPSPNGRDSFHAKARVRAARVGRAAAMAIRLRANSELPTTPVARPAARPTVSDGL
jgi:hypothetical protein